MQTQICYSAPVVFRSMLLGSLWFFVPAIVLAQVPTAPSSPAPPPPVVAQNSLRVVVIDPAHGSTDSGARGAGGIIEKDVTLAIARALRSELAKQGFEVVLTREGNENPSFDDRAAIANAQRGAVFLTLHVGSTGRLGSVRSYYFSVPAGAQAGARGGLVRWEQAQVPHAEKSRRLAELLQVQLGLKFQGSPEVPVASAVRQLRSVTAPAIAVEISSVAAGNRRELESMSADLAAALVRAVNAFRPLYEAGSD